MAVLRKIKDGGTTIYPITTDQAVFVGEDGTTLDEALNNKADKATSTGGFAGGEGAHAESGGAVGSGAATNTGGAVGSDASANGGGAVGLMAKTSNGFAGGFNAKTQDSSGDGIDAIQLGSGTNSTAKTLQVYTYQLMDASGNIPQARISNVFSDNGLLSGTNNNCTGIATTSLGGDNNSISGSYSSIIGGYNNTLQGSNSNHNHALSSSELPLNSTIIGGHDNNCTNMKDSVFINCDSINIDGKINFNAIGCSTIDVPDEIKQCSGFYANSPSIHFGPTETCRNSLVLCSTNATINPSGGVNSSRACIIGAESCSADEGAVVFGRNNTALAYQFKLGHHATDGVPGETTGTIGDAFIIGNGTRVSARSNAFRVTYAGAVYGKSAFNSSGADYAEYFEWVDSNSNDEDRRGLFVTCVEDKIQLANPGDDIIGVISANPSVIGNAQEDTYKDMYEKDVFGAPIKDEDGNYKLNPNYDSSKEYIPYSERPEFGIVGLLGQLIVVDDGTCTVGGYCTSGKNGIGTKSDKGYKVLKRIDSNHIKILIK